MTISITVHLWFTGTIVWKFLFLVFNRTRFSSDMKSWIWRNIPRRGTYSDNPNPHPNKQENKKEKDKTQIADAVDVNNEHMKKSKRIAFDKKIKATSEHPTDTLILPEQTPSKQFKGKNVSNHDIQEACHFLDNDPWRHAG